MQIEKKIYSRCTVVILCYDRHKFIERAIAYWSKINIKILIIHNSKKKISLKFSENITYKNYNASYLKRINLACKLIDTEYCLLAADDDFYLYSEILKSINFLDKNKNYTSYFGQVLSFYYQNKKKFYIQNYKNIISNSINDISVSNRLIKFSKNYLPSSIYSVTRKYNWISNWENVSKSAMEMAGEHEILYELYSIISGKRKIHNRVCLIRSNEVESVKSGDKSIDGLSLSYNWKNNLLNKEILVGKIQKNIESQLDKKYIFLFFDHLTNTRKNNKNFQNLKKNMINKIAKFDFLYNLRSSYNISKGNKFMDLEQSKFFFDKNNIIINMKDFRIINEIIVNFNKPWY